MLDIKRANCLKLCSNYAEEVYYYVTEMDSSIKNAKLEDGGTLELEFTGDVSYNIDIFKLLQKSFLSVGFKFSLPTFTNSSDEKKLVFNISKAEGNLPF